MPGEAHELARILGQRPSSFCNPAFSLGVNFGKSSPCQKLRTGSLNSEYREGPKRRGRAELRAELRAARQFLVQFQGVVGPFTAWGVSSS